MVDFDEQLQQRLQAFQRHHGLTGDGVAGERTWTLLLGDTPSTDAGQQDTEAQPDGGEELQSGARPRPRTEAQARAMVPAHIEPKECFIEFKGSREGWGPISGTGCAHWVAHQRGGPTGTPNACQADFKYRVSDLLATLTQVSADLSGAQVGHVWSAPAGHSHVGIVRAVNRDPRTNAVVSVDVRNDSSASGGVVTQTKTDGSVYH
jgi:peptidoglycan hydrolase-like protein with peptidoglycan-binding domain